MKGSSALLLIASCLPLPAPAAAKAREPPWNWPPPPATLASATPASAPSTKNVQHAASDASAGGATPVVVAQPDTRAKWEDGQDALYQRALRGQQPWTLILKLAGAGVGLKVALDWTVDTLREGSTGMRAWGRAQMARLPEFVARDDYDYGCLRRCAQLIMMLDARKKPYLEDILADLCAVEMCNNYIVRSKAQAARRERLARDEAARRSAQDAASEQAGVGSGGTDRAPTIPPAPPAAAEEQQQQATNKREDTSLYRAAAPEWRAIAARVPQPGVVGATSAVNLERAVHGLATNRRTTAGSPNGHILRQRTPPLVRP